jgi:hypothetical protein
MYPKLLFETITLTKAKEKGPSNAFVTYNANLNYGFLYAEPNQKDHHRLLVETRAAEK